MENLEPDKKNIIERRNRKKPSQSCSFCRLRKLKCDRARPICQSCSMRNRVQCSYEGNITSEENQLRSKYRKCSKFDMARRIEELESRIIVEPALGFKGQQNPIHNVKYLSSKHNRHILYGPTSYRAILASQTDAFARYREDIWKALKRTRNDWKREHQYSTLSEIRCIEAAPSHTKSPSVIQSLCDSLPTYEAFRQCLVDFFASDFFSSFEIVSKRKVLKDLNDCFVKGPKNPKTNCHTIKTINLDIKKNYYKIGVMTVIMCLILHPSKVAESVEVFHKYLTSFVSAKVFYIERVEFLFLRYIYINVAGLDGGDQSHCIFLHGLTIDTAIHIGLNEDIHRLFVNETHPIQEIHYLDRLWLWILFTDIKISLSTGIPLRIDEAFVNEKLVENYSSPKDILLYETVIKLRSIMKNIHARKASPNIPLIIEDLKKFTTKSFKPLKFYLDISKLDGTEFFELQLWHLTLHMLASLASLHFLIYHDYNPIIFNTSILAPLNSLHLCFKVLEDYFELDNRHISSVSHSFFKNWPRLNCALFLVYMDSFRALIQIYTIFLQFIGNNEIRASIRRKMITKNRQIDAGDIEGPCGSCVSLKTAFQKMEIIFEHIHHEKLKPLRSILQNSYYFSMITTMEKIGRKAFGKVIEQIHESPVVEESKFSNNLTAMLNDLEGFFTDFPGDFTEDILGPSDDFFDSAIRGWSDFEEIFSA